MKKVTGLGGIFFKCNDVQKINDWYAQNLGLATGPYGANFEWRDAEQPDKKGLTTWSPFPKDTAYFKPSEKEFMINYRVENLDALVAQLKADGVEIVDEIVAYDYGKFVHLLDPEGNIIELWEPTEEKEDGE
jgi:predicted enzyme related to lactoylglutathione lyase